MITDTVRTNLGNDFSEAHWLRIMANKFGCCIEQADEFVCSFQLYVNEACPDFAWLPRTSEFVHLKSTTLPDETEMNNLFDELLEAWIEECDEATERFMASVHD